MELNICRLFQHKVIIPVVTLWFKVFIFFSILINAINLSHNMEVRKNHSILLKFHSIVQIKTRNVNIFMVLNKYKDVFQHK